MEIINAVFKSINIGSAYWAGMIQMHPYFSLWFFIIVITFSELRRARTKKRLKKLHLIIDGYEALEESGSFGEGTQKPMYTAQKLQEMHWQDFEALTRGLFETHGYHASLTQGGGDGGVDIIAMKGNSRFVVSCKRYGRVVEPAKVREIHSVAITHRAQAGFLVTSGHFSDATRLEARAMLPQIHLIDGPHLSDLLNRVPGTTLSA